MAGIVANRGAALSLLLIAFTLFTTRATAQSNAFISPPSFGPNKQFQDNGILTLGDVITVVWNTSYAGATLWLWQDANPEGAILSQALPLSKSGLGTYTWTVSMDGLDLYTIDPSNVTHANGYDWYTNGEPLLPPRPSDCQARADPPVFFFELSNADNSNRFNSHYLNITVPSTTATSAAATASATLPASASSLAATATATNPTSSNSTGGLSQSATIGIGVGVGVGLGALLLGLAAGFFLSRRPSKRGSRDSPATGPYTDMYPMASPPLADRKFPQQHYTQIQQVPQQDHQYGGGAAGYPPRPHELGTAGDPQEMPGQR